MTEQASTHPVLVVGAGPVGLSLVLALRRAGVEAVAVDRDAGPSRYPKGRVVSTRSMELLRRWGVADRVHAASLPDDWTERIVVGGTLSGPELCRVESGSPAGSPPPSPERRVLCTQNHLERILADAVAELAPDAVRWNSTALAVDDRGDHVEVTVRGADGRVDRRTARYVVVADGCRGLGAGADIPGSGNRRRVLRQVSFRFRADLRPFVADRPAFVSYLVGGGFPAALLVVDGAEDWILMTVAGRHDEPDDFPTERLRGILADVVGLPATDPVIATASIEPARIWDIGYRVADRFVHGRVIRAGDAAHELPPTGTVGLNLGMSDVDSLAWRLVASLGGWAGPGLLTGYERERRPVVERTARWTRRCLNAAPNLAVAAARDDRAALAAVVARDLASYLDHPGIDLGPLLPPQVQEPSTLIDDGRPGSRAPHLPLAGGGSTLDHYRDAAVLLVDECVAGSANGWAASARERTGVPLRVLSMPSDAPTGAPTWQERHGVPADGAVLVRPDGYVWWRGRWPARDGSIELETAVLGLAGHPDRG